ncbi:hypothetical protein BO70DRAFT_63827 [Aspergillus heteromorphus CBS 117.55]|uniref:Uncharacterized protein n=1 Tax=Aspergillus heteromorphus CBS 117.55 TaxID=1448321 RepID=A0A317VSM7_9EURO|nr:uncharacterized protein BO70DRAFT_63827 [Aspergillus heteromorphus CBS 117.55]PWY77333.1 hypothetical protein BO70DRAFT_63827 [Aspergillus heteromorphus CBS 117.55]
MIMSFGKNVQYFRYPLATCEIFLWPVCLLIQCILRNDHIEYLETTKNKQTNKKTMDTKYQSSSYSICMPYFIVWGICSWVVHSRPLAEVTARLWPVVASCG